jgi:hypothetical protein
MKRIISLIVIGLLISSTAYAWLGGSDYQARLEFNTYIADNSTGTYSATYVSKAVIVPGKAHILGYKIIQLDGAKSSEFVAALHDAEITDVYLDESMIDECEVNITTNNGVWFPYPKSIKTQLCIRQGPNTRVIVYYDPK